MKSAELKKINILTRRQFLKSSAIAAAGALTAPIIVPVSVFGADAPSNRITLGCIGVGRMGLVDLKEVLEFKNAQVIAVCDVDSKRAESAKQIVEERYSERKQDGAYKCCAVYKDFRELIAREDIDAVLIVTPDHWHALPAIATAKAGKDIFLQKPLTLTIEEGRVLSDTVSRYGCVLQVGCQQRSDSKTFDSFSF